ncbi:PYR1-like 4 [Actinidia rufa]|uniref:PYR1-like 4 n=1 Tax=Actinidia rufa TaxID=165716 RepID=A0A7J0EC49_9ERIC|nr:PYR1-like 4 [Actinidia rufa]
MHTSLQLHRINTTATSAAAAAVAISHYHKPSQTIWRPPFSVPDDAIHHHTHAVGPGQCCSAMVQSIAAPVATVWPLVRRFDNPQAYKHFLKKLPRHRRRWRRRLPPGGPRCLRTARRVQHRAPRDPRRRSPRHQLQRRRWGTTASKITGPSPLSTSHPPGRGQLSSNHTSLTYRPVTPRTRRACSLIRSYGAIYSPWLRSLKIWCEK